MQKTEIGTVHENKIIEDGIYKKFKVKKIRGKFEHGNYSIQLNLDIKEM